MRYNGDEKTDRILGTLSGAALSGILSILLISGISGGINKDLLNGEVEKATEQVKENLISKVEIDNLDVKSAQIYEVKNGGLVSFYGEYMSHSVTEGGKKIAVVSNFYVDKYLAERTIKAFNKIQDDCVNLDSFKVFTKKQTNKEMKNYEELLNCLNLAINNKYLGTSEIANANELKNAVEKEMVGTYQILGVSQVYYSEDNKTNFFYIDTARELKDGKFTLHRARIEVDGDKLESEEVYAKFLCGQDSKFVDVTNSNVKKQLTNSFFVVDENVF